MIDWKNLEPLPRKPRQLHPREMLAIASHKKKCAKHAGRNHLRNWERRAEEKLKKRAREKEERRKALNYRGYLNLVRAYWSGEIDEHPSTELLA